MERILIVDDDPAVRQLVTAVLSGEGYDVVSRPDGWEGQEFLEKEGATVNAVVLGWQMPRMTGLELLHWIKAHPVFNNTPVIMQTSLRAADQVKEGIDAGAFYYLTKPDRKSVV
jgi:DNA-binding response OmpR family regulator